VLSWWSIQHLPPAELPVVFGEFHRLLAEGGHLLVGFHDGDEHRRPSEAYGHPVSYDTYLLPPEHVAELLGRAGFTVTARLHQPGYKWPGRLPTGQGVSSCLSRIPRYIKSLSS
jgi:hypothetical protein